MSEARALPSLLLYRTLLSHGGRAVSLTHNAESRGHTVHETRHLCWLQWGQNKRCYFYVRIDHTIKVQGALQKSRYQPETGPCLLLGAADVRRSTYGKGCNSKFDAFSGFMNPRLSAAI